MLRRLKGLFSRKEAEPEPGEPGPLHCPAPVVAVGDIHGRIDLLERMIARAREAEPEATLVFVGDYVDRGEDSAAVLARLMRLTETDDRVVCLMGNHEDMALGFIDETEAKGAFWLRHGGLQTLASYGVGGVTVASRGLELLRARDELVVRMGQETIGWLRSRPLSWAAGSVAIVHAAADPGLPIDGQDRTNLLWGHKDFLRKGRTDGMWVVHGHTIVASPQVQGGRIAIDTGAYATGVLSGVAVGEQGMRFIAA